MMIRLLGLVVVAGIVAWAMVLWRRAARNPLFLPAAKRKTGPLGRVRIACGVLGGLLFLGTVYGTVITVLASYRPLRAPANLTVQVPTMATETPDVEYTPPESPGRAPGERVKSARLLATVLVMDTRATEPQPVRVVQLDVHWPEGPNVEKTFQLGGLRYTYRLDIDEVSLGHGGGTGLWVAGGQMGYWVGAFRAQGGSTTRFNQLVGAEAVAQPNLIFNTFRGGSNSGPLSVTPGTPPQCYCLLLISRVSEKDPLQTVPIEQFVEARREMLMKAGLYGMPFTQMPNKLDELPAGAIRLAGHLGLSMLSLLAAAVLVAQVFRRRDLALTGLLLGMVLYVAVADRVVLAYDASRLADAKETLQSRMVACSRMTATLFYKDTAYQELQDVTGPMPPMLHEWVDEILRRLADGGLRKRV